MNFKNKKFLPIFLSSLFLVSCSDKIIFHFNKNKIVKTFKDHFGWKKDAAGWGSEDDNKTWNQIVFNINFKKDLESFVSSSSFRNNFSDQEKQSNNILYLPQNFSFNTSVTKVPTTEDELKKFKFSIDFRNPDFKLCYFIDNIDNFKSTDLKNNSILNKDDSQIWNILFKNYNNITSNNDFQINIIVQDLLDSSYYLANYTLGADYSNVQLKNIYFLDQSEKMNNLLKNLNFQNKDKTKGPQLNLGELNKYFTNNQIGEIKNHLQNDDIKANFLSFFNLGKDTNPPKDKTQINSNYNLDFFKKKWDVNKHQCQNNGDMYVCSVNNFLKTENWKSDKSFDFFTLYDIDSNGKIILTCKLEINYDNDGNPTFFNVLLDNFYYNNN